VQIGIRHIMPIYPFMTVLAGAIVPWAGRRRLFRPAAALGLLLYAASVLLCAPYFLAYFNAAVGGARNGYHWLIDSNLDWGQSLPQLAGYLKARKVDGIYLAYFGTADPHYYGIRYIPVGCITNLNERRTGDSLDMRQAETRLLAISATNLQATYYADKETFSYFRARTPVAVLGQAIFVYDITADRRAHGLLRELFARSGDALRVAMQDAIIKELYR